MAELSTIARPYAEAYFQVVSIDATKTETASNELKSLVAISQVPEVREAMADPRLDKVQRAELFLSLVKSELSESSKNFVRLLVDNDRLLLLPEILEHFEQLKNAKEGSAACVITSAFELTEDQLRELTAMLEKKFGYKLKPVVKVDNTLIGGVRVTVGDQVLDTSVQGQLVRLHETLTAI
ncbi:F0F1 ATP synthase subunit delta [Basilea psittacipulmonis]|uniref:ATP synthase subunit delta n=1 Tax=Basilea psittacipulmonis DSM 24701 TaxID=1072685 RepID=A0A077DGG3_9BURK|nr:F0F1 ATP synthase subunit delta [Basilea psittacipulmonis]AIL32567.1 ATP synthase F0F1 subunit delta [Basilea psittacipulmonis DSM 24701]